MHRRRRLRRDQNDDFDQEELELALALSASLVCNPETRFSEVPVSGVPVSEVPVSELPVSEVPVSEVPVSGVPVSRVPVSGVPVSEVALSTVSVSELPDSEVPDIEATAVGRQSDDEDDDTFTPRKPRRPLRSDVTATSSSNPPSVRIRLKRKKKAASSSDTFNKDKLPGELSSEQSSDESNEDAESASYKPNPFSWEAMAAELTEEFASAQMKRLAESAQSSRKIDISTERHVGMPLKLVGGIDDAWLYPPLGQNWPSTLTRLQVDALYAARKYVFQRIISLGEMWRKDQSMATNQNGAVLDGHHLAAAIMQLRVPIRQDDLRTMLPTGNLFTPLEKANGHEAKKAAPMDLRQKRVTFAKEMLVALKLARWPRSVRDEPVPSITSTTTNEMEHSLPAFDAEKAPKDYNVMIDWDMFCKVFDLVQMRVEKNGRVW